MSRYRAINALNAMLADMDEGKMPDGSVKLFSIGFYNARGEYVYMPLARRTGLKQNMKRGDFKGVVAVNERNEEIGHPYPVYIHFIRNYKSKTFKYQYESSI